MSEITISPSPKDVAKFESKFTKTDGCWLWEANTNAGYGTLYFDGKSIRAHRFSYMLYVAPIPTTDSGKTWCVCHHCDVPACVRPSHLFVGTHIDNMRDREKKGRNVISRGEAQGSSKLTEAQVWEIFHAEGTQTEIGARFGIDHSQVGRIKRKDVWVHIHA